MRFILYLLLQTLFIGVTHAQVRFDSYFLHKTLRFDYIHAGNFSESTIYVEQFKEEPIWAGSTTHLIDPFKYGNYLLSVYDKLTNTLIYSRGYSTLFAEWQDTKEATHTQRSFYENVVFPFPKRKVRIEIAERNINNEFVKKFQYDIDPFHYSIVRDVSSNFPVRKAYYSGSIETKLDIVVLPEGYTASEMNKFESDSKRFIEYFFRVSPFSEQRDKVNFWLVLAPSLETGTDIPGDRIWKNTLFDTHFYTFGSRRYISTRNMKQVRDIAAQAPYDQIYILVNTSEYGGGGIYNYYNLCVSDHDRSEEVFTHEFGHAFAALADEYAYGTATESPKFNSKIEPWEANLTTLVNFDSKWKDLVSPKTPLPTPESLSNVVGAFEGGNNLKRNIYRPMFDCKMRSNNQKSFCPVCHRTILSVLELYTN